jgi:hypothetical protein
MVTSWRPNTNKIVSVFMFSYRWFSKFILLNYLKVTSFVCLRLLVNEDTEESNHWSYMVQTFNIMVLCGEDYIVEPGSLR